MQDLEREERESRGRPGADAESFQAAREDMARSFGEGARRQAAEAERLSAEMQGQYDAILKRLEAQRLELKNRVERQWTVFRESTNKEWVDYNERGDSLSRVDFEKGEVELEVLIPVEDAGGDKAKAKKLAEEKVREQLRKIVTEKDERKEDILKDQLKTPQGAPVTEKNADEFVKKELAPKMTVEDKPVVAKDGKPRLKVKVAVGMDPEHIKLRAKSNAPRVTAAAKKFGLDPALVFAVIHTESFFNPRARSAAPAFGLMQLMSQSGAREAYKFLYKEDKIVSPEYLYDPDNNVLLGAAYLHMLLTLHFGKVKNPDNRRLLSVAAYNCGPGCVRKFVLSKNDVDRMRPAETAAVLRRAVPKETQEYVPKVESRMALYRGL